MVDEADGNRRVREAREGTGNVGERSGCRREMEWSGVCGLLVCLVPGW